MHLPKRVATRPGPQIEGLTRNKPQCTLQIVALDHYQVRCGNAPNGPAAAKEGTYARITHERLNCFFFFFCVGSAAYARAILQRFSSRVARLEMIQ